MINFLTGGAVSLASEGLKTFLAHRQDKADKEHRLKLAELETKLGKELASTNAEKTYLEELGRTNRDKTKSKWVNALNALVRPSCAFVCLFVFVKVTLFAINQIIDVPSLYESTLAYEFAMGRVAYFDSVCDTVFGFFFVKRSFQK